MFTTIRTRLATWSAAIGAVVAAINCTVMIAATIVGVLGVIGIRVSAEFADGFNGFLSPVAQPLPLVSLALIVIGVTPRGRVPVVFALIGSLLVYLAMFILPGGPSGMAGMGGMSASQADPFSLAVFWLGVTGLVAAFIIAYRR
jgi:hypothetical protein